MSLQSNPDPGRTLGQFGLAVLALVVFAAGSFWLIDLVSDDPETVAAPGVEETSATPSPTLAPTPSPSPAAPSPEPSPAPEASPAPEPTGDESTGDESTAEPTEDESTPEPSDDPTTEEPTEEATEDEDDVDLSETSVQVLDAIKDGSDRAQEIADDLEDDGYRVVAFGPSSIQYENTTVFWTEGHEDEADRLAGDNGWDEIVFNEILSETVDVHVVVGLDEQE